MWFNELIWWLLFSPEGLFLYIYIYMLKCKGTAGFFYFIYSMWCKAQMKLLATLSEISNEKKTSGLILWKVEGKITRQKNLGHMGRIFLEPCCGKNLGQNWPVLGYVSSCMSLPFYEGWILIVELSAKTEKSRFQHYRIHSRSFHIDLLLTLIRSGYHSHSTAFPSPVYSFEKEPVSFTVFVLWYDFI